MKLNLMRPVQWTQWYLYLVLLLCVQAFVLSPLAVALFHQLYRHLVSTDSVQVHPWNKLQSHPNYHYETAVARVAIDTPLAEGCARNDGLVEPVVLKTGTNYQLELQLPLYCQSYSEEVGVLNTVLLRVWLDEAVVYKERVNVVCHGLHTDTQSVGEGGVSVRERYRTMWLNQVALRSSVLVGSHVQKVGVTLDTLEPRTKTRLRLLFERDALMRFTLDYHHDVRQFMLKHKWITYVAGTVLVQGALTWFFAGAVVVVLLEWV